MGPSPPETTAIVQSDVRGSSSTPLKGLKTQAWSARTPQCAFKSASPVEKLAHGVQSPPKPGLGVAPSGPKFPRNDYDSSIRCTGRLQHTLGETYEHRRATAAVSPLWSYGNYPSQISRAAQNTIPECECPLSLSSRETGSSSRLLVVGPAPCYENQ